MSLSIGVTIASGQRVWAGDIKNMHELLERSKFDTFKWFKAAFRKASISAIAMIESNVLPTVAELTGLLRADFMNSFETNYDIRLSNDYAQAEFHFNVQRFISDLMYAKYHLVQDPNFRYPNGYRYPTTPNTQPIDLVLFDGIVDLLSTELVYNMRLWGFDI